MSASDDKDMTTGRTDSARLFFKTIEGLKALGGDPVLRAALDARPAGKEAYLVGGMPRNIALGAPVAPDYDLAFDGDTRKFASNMAASLGGSFFALDEEAGAWRVVTRGDRAVTVDFTPLAQGGIVQDLARRDFTVNAMAVPLSDLQGESPRLIDPFGGLDDALSRVLRTVSQGVFDDDPARLLRAVRLSAQYGLGIPDDTIELIRLKAKLLDRCSPERARDELVRLLSCPSSSGGVALLFDTGLIEAVVPEVRCWRGLDYDLLSHTLAVVREADRLLENLTEEAFPGVADRLREYFSRAAPVPNGALLRLAALFHDMGKAYTLSREAGRLRFTGHDSEGAKAVSGVMERLRFGKKTASTLSLLVKNHHRAFMLAALEKPTYRAKCHFFRVMGGEVGIMLLCLALVDARATRGAEDTSLRATVLEMMRFYYGEYSVSRPEPVMTGREVMRAFGVEQGPAVGKILGKIAEGVEKGLVTDAADAVAFVKRWLREGKDKADTG